VVQSTYDNARENIARAIALTGGLSIPEGKSILIKINLCGPRLPDSATVTHPLFLDACLSYLRTEFPNHKIFAVESDATVAQPDVFLGWFGLKEVLDKWSVGYSNLSKQPTFPKPIKGRFLKTIDVPEIFGNSFLISIPKLKTNLASSLTCCLKNQFGCLPEPRKVKYHKHLDDVIVDANLAMKPDYCIVDAILAMGGDLGPGLGTPIPFNTIICGTDPVAIDAFCAKNLGFRPWQVGHIRKAAGAGLGSTHYAVVGEKPLSIDFETSKLRMFLFKFGSWLQSRNKK
jgi:uncharacterized protein (DUF362 family)